MPSIKYLKENDIQNHEWLGFFSQIWRKTGLGAEDVSTEVTMVNDDIDACLFTRIGHKLRFSRMLGNMANIAIPALLVLAKLWQTALVTIWTSQHRFPL